MVAVHIAEPEVRPLKISGPNTVVFSATGCSPARAAGRTVGPRRLAEGAEPGWAEPAQGDSDRASFGPRPAFSDAGPGRPHLSRDADGGTDPRQLWLFGKDEVG